MTFEESYQKFNELFENKLSSKEAKELLIELYERGESAEEIAGAAKAMREHSVKLEVPLYLKNKIIDIVGTGGDKSGSFNISSTVAIILASLGSFVAKHGNRAITSNSGAADMLENLGINLNLSKNAQIAMLEEVGFTFMFAVNHHPAMKYIMPIRKSLPHRTIFNILGPLTNPAGAKKYLLGVFSESYIEPLSESLKLLGANSALVVSSKDGMDEISISDVTYAKLLDGSEFEINPEDLGFKLAPMEAINGGDASKNAQITLDILKGFEKGAKRDIVLLNTSAALFADGKVRDMREGIEMVKEAIDSKRAYEHLQRVVSLSKKLS